VPQGIANIGVSDARFTTRDGTTLVSRVWRPSGPGAWPTLLMRQPYGRAIASTVTYAHPHWYASHGYAVVVQDVRGRGCSEGQFGGFAQEAADGAETLGWLRSQSWCNGRVGTYGFSYQGLSQLLSNDPSQLPDALAPAMAGLDERRHWASSGDAHWWALGLGWALQLAAESCRRQANTNGWQAIRSSLASGAFLTDGLSLLRQHDPRGMGLAWLQRDPADPVGWTQHEPLGAIWSRPMLQIGGWHDPYLDGVLELWHRAHQGNSDQRLRIGAWTHLNWQGGIDRLQLAFFDRHLKGCETPRHDKAKPPGELMADMGTGQWCARSPRVSSGQHWGLVSDGLAAIDASEGVLGTGPSRGTVVLVHDPWRPLPGRGGHLGLDAGVVDRADLDNRADVACFSSAPFGKATEVLGRPLLELPVCADQPGFDLCVALSVLNSRGEVRQVSTGVARFLGASCLTLQTRRVALQPLLLTVQPGEQLRLSVGAAAWPQIAVNPGNGAMPQGPSGMDHRVIGLELHLAGAQLGIHPMVTAN
jgi:hypothetical protein